ncbi:restriction endonuclease subunit S [Adhaeribacter radiodurans]|uniref:Restriction endonuclease subunit S n=1 Tax=Adhaeribacter radiodurans TaxID=2745197 RepID=A0A7L7LCD4_9BACT|nr:restriction endonuclease subunit S [Adhaeribacter radiodurans]QMU30506.1 restriction endonuclease subunit S [Adhaeribacter radiodurans]
MRGKELPENWVEASISEFIANDGIFIDGDWVESKDQDVNGDVRLIQLADIGVGEFRDKSFRFLTSEKAKELKCTFLNEGDILVARMPDPLGRACIFPLSGKYVTVVDVAVIRPGQDGVNPKWLMYIINSPKIQKEIYELASGSTRLRISRGNLSKISFPLPPLAEQKRIVAKLDEAFQHLDALKAKLERIPELLKTFRQAVLTQAVTGKLTEKWREVNANIESANELLLRLKEQRAFNYMAQCDDATKAGKRKPRKIFLEEIPEIDYGITTDIPESWTITNIEFLAFVTKLAGFEYTNYIKYEQSGEIPVVRAQNVQMGKFVEDNLVYIDKETSDFLERSQLHGRELLMVFIGAGTGNVCLAPNDKRWHLAPNVAKIDVDGISVEYLNYYLQSSIGFENAMSFVKATAQPSLSMETIRQIVVQLPPLEEQKEIVKKVDALFSKADTIDTYYTGLKEKIDKLPNALLVKAFRGELVPQDPEDEPASVLLEKIKTVKEKQTQEKKKYTPNKTIRSGPEQMKKNLKPVKDYKEFLERLNNIGGSATPEQLLIESALEKDVDSFFEFLREGRDSGSLDVPVGKSGTINMIINAD